MQFKDLPLYDDDGNATRFRLPNDPNTYVKVNTNLAIKDEYIDEMGSTGPMRLTMEKWDEVQWVM